MHDHVRSLPKFHLFRQRVIRAANDHVTRCIVGTARTRQAPFLSERVLVGRIRLIARVWECVSEMELSGDAIKRQKRPQPGHLSRNLVDLA